MSLNAEWSNKYAYEDWVEEKYGKDCDGKRKKTPHLVPVKSGARRLGVNIPILKNIMKRDAAVLKLDYRVPV